MLKTVCFTLAACIAGSVAAQMPKRPDPADPKAAAPARPYESVFKSYRAYSDPDLARWREVNDEMGRLNGHVGHVPGAAPGRGSSAATKPPPATGQGGHK